MVGWLDLLDILNDYGWLVNEICCPFLFFLIFPVVIMFLLLCDPQRMFLTIFILFPG